MTVTTQATTIIEKQALTENRRPQSLARKAGIFTISRALTILSQLMAMVVLTHQLSGNEAGLVFFLLTIYGTAQAFAQLGLPDSIFYFFEKMPPASRKGIVLLISRTLLAISLVGALVMLGIAWVAATREGFGELRLLIWAMMGLLIFELPTLTLPNILIATDRARAAAGLNIFTGLLQFLAMTLPLLLPNPVAGITWGLLGYGIIRLVISGWFFRQLFAGAEGGSLPPGTLKELLYYAVPLSLAQVFWGLNRQLDKYVVQWFLPASFAVYAAGAYEIPVVPTIAYSVAAVMMPQLVGHYFRGETSALLELWYKSIRKVSALVIPLVMVFLVAAEEFIALLFPDSYAEAVVPFRIYTVILLQRVASYSNMQKALGSTGDITRGAVYLFLVNATLSVPLVMWLGVAGPPLASLLANMFTWWYALDCIRRSLKIGFFQSFPFAFYLRTLAVAMVATLPALVLKFMWSLPAAAAFPTLALVYLLTYLMLARLSGVVGQEDWRRMLRALRLAR